MTDARAIPADYRNPVIHDRGPSSYPGDWQVTDEALANYGIARELFGTTEVLNADGTTFRVKDYQYCLPDGSVGMNLLPVNDHGAAPEADGSTVYGSTLVDELLRERMGLKPDDQIFAFMYYIHPELNRGSVLDFAKTDKAELGITHMGAYLGGGRTSDSPPLYHNRVWNVKGEIGSPFGYPANVAVLSMAGTDQAMLNKNLYLVDAILNNGVRFPTDYKNSQFRMADLNTALMFYRDWVREEQYLRTDTSWFTYCAAHKTLVANVGVNLPHNLEAFKDVYGAAEGAEFFKLFSDFHFQVFGTEFTAEYQTEFEPLWRKAGLNADRARAFTLPEYTAWDAARMAGTLGSYSGFKPLAPDEGSPWAPQMTADFVADFVQTYADFIDAGAIAFSATIIGYITPVTERTRIGKLAYLMFAMPIAQQAMLADARIHAAAGAAPDYRDSPYYQQTAAALYGAFGGKDQDVKGALAGAEAQLGTLSPADLANAVLSSGLLPAALAWAALMLVRAQWVTILAGGAIAQDVAYTDFMTAIQPQFQLDRAAVVSSPEGIQYNTPPSIGHMIATGMYACNPAVSLTTVATVMDHTEMVRKSG